MEMTNILPDDLWEEILLRLQVSHLLRLRCVSKSWCALIDDYTFIRKHYEFQYAFCKANGDVPVLLSKLLPDQLYLLSKQRGDVLLDLTPNMLRDSAPYFTSGPGGGISNFVFCSGVVNGVVWLQWWSDSAVEIHMALWNLSTREFKVLPIWPNALDKATVGADPLGLGFDSVSNDFKIVGSVTSSVEGRKMETITHYELYSISTNSWKKIREPPADVYVRPARTDAYLNGVYYWAARVDWSHSVILSFDFRKEVFKVSYPPQGCEVFVMVDEREFRWEIALYMERLAVIVRRAEFGVAVCSIDVWVVSRFEDDNDRGAPLSWQCLVTIEQIPALYEVTFDTFRMDGNLLLAVESERQAGGITNIYNPLTRTFKSLEIIVSSCFRYVESLFPCSKKRFRSCVHLCCPSLVLRKVCLGK